MHGVQKCGLLLPMFRGLRVCLLDITVSCAKTVEPIEMPFGQDLRVQDWVYFSISEKRSTMTTLWTYKSF